MKLCTRCRIEKPSNEYNKPCAGRIHGWCKECHQTYNKKRFNQRKQDGMCPQCKTPVSNSAVHCDDCRAHLRNLRSNRKSNGLCIDCGIPALQEQSRCEKHLEMKRTRMRQHHRNMKSRSISYLGGKCQDCGLETNKIEVYDFHHLDSEKKEFIISPMLHKNNWILLQKELDKCILLCANCHRSRHAYQPTS